MKVSVMQYIQTKAATIINVNSEGTYTFGGYVPNGGGISNKLNGYLNGFELL